MYHIEEVSLADRFNEIVCVPPEHPKIPAKT